ncbi:MAG: branched-chain amino acid ABC transporter permease, partial [Deltaproteobacteria bacterium]
MIWVSVVIQGVLLGAVYALFACGLSLMFGVMRIINLAHGDIAVVGAYLVWVVATRAGVSPFVAMVAVVPVMLVAGYGLHLALLRRSLAGGPL